ncbi:MAG: ion transporter [Verrucomicrobiaceae bacterium]|nr:ion transporter [Verrucomicrobiaceae bacterium]
MGSSKKTLTRQGLRRIIFDHNTRSSKAFDVILLIVIGLAVVVAMLESVDVISRKHGQMLRTAEWIFTILFMLEYSARLYCSNSPLKYALSPFGVIDLLGWIPLWLTLLIDHDAAHYLTVIRMLRMLRVFRILSLRMMTNMRRKLKLSLNAARPAILSFMLFVVILVTILGSLMYIIEGTQNPDFSSIPTSIYWAISSITTVGFGDITPITPLGKIIASIMMLIGYAIIAVPTGIVVAAMNDTSEAPPESGRACPECGRDYSDNTEHCENCSGKLEEDPANENP